MGASNDATRRAQAAVYGAWYQRLQALWRQGEELSVERWGRLVEAEVGEAWEMHRLALGIEGLMREFFEDFKVDKMNAVDLVELNEWEREILRWLVRGYDVAMTAARTNYSREQVYARLRALRQKLGVRTDAGIVVEALRLGLIDIPGNEEMLR